MLISDIIGAVDSFGGVTKKGLPFQARQEAIRREQARSRGVKIRRASRDEIAMIPSHFRAGISRLIEEVEQKNALTVTMDRRACPSTRRILLDQETIEFDERGEAVVPFGVALRLFSCDRYMRLVREVNGAAKVEPAPQHVSMSPREAREFADLKARLEEKESALDAKLAQLDAALASVATAPTPEPTPQPTPSSAKKSSKKRG